MITLASYINLSIVRIWSYVRGRCCIYNKRSRGIFYLIRTTTQLLQGSSGVRAKIWSNYTQDKAYILQHSYSKAPVELEPKFGQIIQRQSIHTTTQLLQGSSGARAKIWSNYTQDKAYILQHSYSKAPVELEPKFGQIIHKTKPTYVYQIGECGMRHRRR